MNPRTDWVLRVRHQFHDRTPSYYRRDEVPSSFQEVLETLMVLITSRYADDPSSRDPHSINYIVKAHPWFRGVDWTNIHRYDAPYRPELRHPEDTRHFDDDIPAVVRIFL